MDSFEVDSNASLDSFHFSSEDFNPPSPYAPMPSTPESSKKLHELELENEKLRLTLESSRSEIDVLQSSNRALKQKIAELFQEAQASLEDKLKLQNTLKDRVCQLAMVENSLKWYQTQLHESEAAKKLLKTDQEAYQKILYQREQTIADYIEKSEKNQNFKIQFEQLATKHQMECKTLQKELNWIKNNNSPANLSVSLSSSESQKDSEEIIILELKKAIEDMSRDLEIAEKRYLNVETLRRLEERSSLRCKEDFERIQEDFNAVEIEKNKAIEKLNILNIHGDDLRIENERLNLILLSSKKEKVEVEDGIVQLRLQLMKMIAQYKALKSRNSETERTLGKAVEKLKEVREKRKR